MGKINKTHDCQTIVHLVIASMQKNDRQLDIISMGLGTGDSRDGIEFRLLWAV